MKKPLCIVIVGPTASGKSSLAVAVAKKENGEVVSADSMQIYKRMDIATAKVTEEEADGVPHHLLDEVDPRTEVTVHDFHKRASQLISILFLLAVLYATSRT